MSPRRMKHGGILLAALCSGCMTVPVAATPQRLAMLDRALTADVQELRRGADTDDVSAQYALAIAMRYGLNGIEQNLRGSEWYARKAISAKRMMPITTYMAGLNGAPGRVHIIHVQTPILDHVAVGVVERCITLLRAGPAKTPALDASACGDTQNYQRLRTAWDRSVAQNP